MPEWVVHNYAAKNFCNLPEGICNEIDKFMDFHPLGHDVNRIIVNGHWDPEALLYLGIAVYEEWSYNGLRCVLHHNLLDYAHTLASTGPYGAMIRRLALPGQAKVHIKGLVHKVLDNVVNDFSPILEILDRGGSSYEVIQRIESSVLWSVKDLKSFVDVLKKHYITDFLKDLLKAVNELKDCIDLCIEEVIGVEFWHSKGFSDLCPYCVTSTYLEKEVVLIPEEYISKNLAFKVHRQCFERLINIVKSILTEGFEKRREVIEEVMRRTKSLPPSLIWEAVKRAKKI